MAEPVTLIVPWWRVALDVAAVVGTFSAVSVALFGQAFRAKFFPPRLTLSLADELGEATKVRIEPPPEANTAPRIADGRYYHLRVENRRRWSPATDSRIVLLQMEEKGPNGEWQVRWTGDIPFQWRYGDVLPVLRVIGPVTFADLCSVIDGKWLQIHTLIQAIVLNPVRREPTEFAVTVQAHAAEASSNILRLEISWDGKFHPGSAEMRRHLTVAVRE